MSDDRVEDDSFARMMEAHHRVAADRELYSEVDGRPILRPSLVAYLDGLGTKERITNLSQTDLCAHLETLDWLRPFLHNPAFDGSRQRLLSFSDNVVLGVPTDQPTNRQLWQFFHSVAIYQLHSALQGEFVRGGLAFGPLFMDGQTVIGPALIDAVRLEEEVAVFPRVVLSDALVDVLERALDQDNSQVPHTWTDCFLVDADGRVFLDYLIAAWTVPGRKSETTSQAYVEHRDMIERQLAAGHSTRIREKYLWLASYHNFSSERRWWGSSGVRTLSRREADHGRLFRTSVFPARQAAKE